MTLLLRTRMDIDVSHGMYHMGALFYALVIFLAEGVPELSMTVSRLEVFYKQKELRFYPAWAYTIPTAIIILLLALHFASISMFCFLASIFQTADVSLTAGSFAMLLSFLFGGFVITKPSMPIGLSVNEFLAPRWQRVLPTNTTIGRAILESRGLNFDGYFFWISLGALAGFALIFNIGFTLALSILKAPGSSYAIISQEELSRVQGREDSSNDATKEETTRKSHPNLMVLPFEPLTVVFQDLQYCVDIPLEMKEEGFNQKKLQLLSDITGALRPGVLTALMGVSGAGKTTLLDVLAGRKTSGNIKGEIKIGGYPEVQETFARIAGYCEQTDIHSPQLTVEESVTFSAWLRLAPEIDSKTKAEFVDEVLQTIALDEIKDVFGQLHTPVLLMSSTASTPEKPEDVSSG
ncbi:hypothetical protein SLA2020_058860 [Shorea laevis]